MKRSEMLDLMGEIDEYYIEDAARHLECSPRRLWQQWSRPAGAAAAAGIMCFSALMIYGVIRDGIASQNQGSYSESAAYSPENTYTGETVPPDLFEVLPDTATATSVAETEPAVTETTAIGTAAPHGAEPDDNISDEMPNSALEQEIGSRFTVNWLSQSGILAMTVLDAQCYDSFEDAGLTYDDMTYDFRKNNRYTPNSVHGIDENGNFVSYYSYFPFQSRITEHIQANYESYRFIKATVKIENLNAVSSLAQYSPVSLPDGTFDESFARDYDFDIRGMYFGVIDNPNYERETYPTEHWAAWVQYFSLSGEEYAKDDSMRSEWFYLPPGESVVCEVGGFVPKFYGKGPKAYIWQDIHYEDGEDLLPYYFFGSGGLTRPHILLNLAE